MSKNCFSCKKSMLYVVIFFILFITSIIVQAEKSKLILSVEDVNALIPEIESAERRLLNIKVEAEAWIEEKPSLSAPWKRTPVYASCTAWLDGRPRSKARVDVHKQVLKWVDGAAPYGEESYSVSFDGQYGRVVDHTFSHSGKTHLSKRGELLSDFPRGLRSTWFSAYTGAQFSFQFFFNDEGYTFSQFFRAAVSPEALKAKPFEVAREEFQGVECIRFGTGKQAWGCISYWLDPSRGFSLLGHDNISIHNDGTEKVISRIRVIKLKEVASGIWWPVEAYVESDPLKAGEPYTRTVYRASNVVANDPNLNESIFTVPFPDGYLIDDKVTGKKYRVGEDPNAPKNQPEK